MEIMEYKGIKYNKERVERYAKKWYLLILVIVRTIFSIYQNTDIVKHQIVKFLQSTLTLANVL